MMTLTDALNEELKDPNFKKEWDALEEEYQAIEAKLDAEIVARSKINRHSTLYPGRSQAAFA